MEQTKLFSKDLNMLKQDLNENLSLLRVFLKGYNTFQATGNTPEEAYMAMRRLFVNTNGLFNDLFQQWPGFAARVRNQPPLKSSLVPGFDSNYLRRVVEHLRRDGFYVFPDLVDISTIDPILEFATHAPCTLRTAGKGVDETITRFNPTHLVADNYDVPERAVVNQPIIQKVLADPLFLRVAQSYIGSQVILCTAALWWTTPFSKGEPASNLAQLYHFDMDRLKFLKFFLYVSDVDVDSGPHCYVRGSCKRKPKQFLEDRRFQDDELIGYYGPENLVEIAGPRGTLIAVDTRGFHKAKMPESGNRLALQLEFTSSMFGQNYPHPSLNVAIPELQRLVELDPMPWQNYQVEPFRPEGVLTRI
jgi:hypothetical protein